MQEVNTEAFGFALGAKQSPRPAAGGCVRIPLPKGLPRGARDGGLRMLPRMGTTPQAAQGEPQGAELWGRGWVRRGAEGAGGEEGGNMEPQPSPQ